MLKDFEKYLKEQRLSENSCSSYISDIKQYEKYYRDSYGEDLEKLTSADIQTYKSYLKNRLKGNSSFFANVNDLKNENEQLSNKNK